MSTKPTTKTTTLPTTKRQKLVFLLDHWTEIFDPDYAKGRPGVGDARGPTMPYMSRHPSVRELERCLDLLQAYGPTQYSHLMAYHTAEWRVHRWSERKRRKGGKFEQLEHADRERLVPGWVRLEKVRRAEQALEDWFRGPVFIPDDLWDALTLSSAEVEAKEAKRRRRSA